MFPENGGRGGARGRGQGVQGVGQVRQPFPGITGRERGLRLGVMGMGVCPPATLLLRQGGDGTQLGHTPVEFPPYMMIRKQMKHGGGSGRAVATNRLEEAPAGVGPHLVRRNMLAPVVVLTPKHGPDTHRPPFVTLVQYLSHEGFDPVVHHEGRVGPQKTVHGHQLRTRETGTLRDQGPNSQSPPHPPG